MKSIADACRLLSDPARLRILRLLARETLCTGELAGVLGLSQPATSRQLKSLREAGLVEERREGTSAFYARAASAPGEAGQVLTQIDALLAEAPDTQGDLARLEQLLSERLERRTLPLSGHPDFVPGRSWSSWARALLHLLPEGLVVADVGCGDGGLAIELARSATRVIGIDSEPRVLARAARRIQAAGAPHIELRQGGMEALPLEDGEIDLCLLSQVLHHAGDPAVAVAEAARVLAPGGTLLILDLEPHREEWVRDELGDLHLGLSRDELSGWCAHAGLADLRSEALPRTRGERFQVNVTSARRPRGRRPAANRKRRTG